MKIVVSDTSPLLALRQVGLLNVVGQIMEEVLIPPAVAEELRIPPRGPLPVDLAGMPFVRIVVARDGGLVSRLRALLDSGESEAIALAVEHGIENVLIDEQLGRRVALQYGLRPVGVLGLLAIAKSRCLIPAIRPVVDELRAKHGFYLAPRLVESVLAQLGET